MDAVRAAIQAMLDDEGSGWQLSQSLVVIVGLERLSENGFESVPWQFQPEDQPSWVTAGLLDAADELRHFCVED